MKLPPWVKLCERCKCRYALDPVCPVCREIEESRRYRQSSFAFRAAVFAFAFAWVVVMIRCLVGLGLIK